MNVGELIEHLKGYDLATLIVMSKDGEGNSFSPLANPGDGAYTADTTWSGEVQLLKLTDELRAEGYAEEDVGGPESVPCVVLWPTN